MSAPDEKNKTTPRDRFRNILSAEKEDESIPEARKPAVVNLPKVGAAAEEQDQVPGASRRSDSAFTERLSSGAAGPTIWTVGVVLSVVANLILLSMLLGRDDGFGAAGELLPSMYVNLERLEQAHIRATLPVQTTLALEGGMPLNATTSIVLAEDVAVQGAHVTINTALFNIDAPANVTLPAGTTLPVELDLALPLQSGVPISMNVPIDIAVSATELQPIIQAMKETLRPLVCSTEPGATLPDGSRICQ